MQNGGRKQRESDAFGGRVPWHMASEKEKKKRRKGDPELGVGRWGEQGRESSDEDEELNDELFGYGALSALTGASAAQDKEKEKEKEKKTSGGSGSGSGSGFGVTSASASRPAISIAFKKKKKGKKKKNIRTK